MAWWIWVLGGLVLLLAEVTPGGFEAVQLRVAEQYLLQFGQLAKTGTR